MQQTGDNDIGSNETPAAGFAGLVAAFFICLSFACNAQDLEPRRYVNLPVDQNFIALAYSYTEGDVNFSPSVPLTDAFLRIDAPALAYIRTFGMAGKSSSFDIFQPYVCLKGNALSDGERVARDVCGLGDARVRVSYNFYGAPATQLSEFGKEPRGVVVGVSAQLSIPVGQYDNTKLVNIGTNRWEIKTEIGTTIPWQKWSVEFAAGVRFFLDNDEFLQTSTLEQDPLYNLQAHVHYDISRRQALSFSSNYFFGGETFRDGAPSAIRQENSRLGVSWSVAPNRNHIVKFIVNTGVVTRVGNDSDQYTVAWSYRWE
jgi:hypothetical protein